MGQSGGGETSENAESKPLCQGRRVLVLGDKPPRHPATAVFFFLLAASCNLQNVSSPTGD